VTRKSTFSRRSFLRRGAGAACAAPWVVPGSALGADDAVAPSNRIQVGLIGTGRQLLGKSWPQFMKMSDVRVVAVCDVDAWRLARAKGAVEAHYRGTGCLATGDYRDVLARKDVDAVMVSTPDHWHAPIAIAAAEAGKDVSLEKPITRSIAEGQQIIAAVRKNKRVFRVDSEFRSIEHFIRMAELIRNGRIGQIKSVRVGVPAGDNVDCPPTPEMPVPEDLDYESWQGPAPRAPYTELRVHRPKSLGRPGWMRVLYYCDGMITNWGTHLCDIAQWCNGTERTGPVEIEATGVYPPPGKLWNVMKTFEVKYRFADGTPLVYETSRPYVRVEGTEGWLEGAFSSGFKGEPASLLTSEIKPDEIRFPRKSDKRDFIDAVKTRGRTLEDEEVGHRTTSLCHLGHISARLGQKLRWDPEKERFAGNDAANELIGRPIHTARPS